MPTNGKYMGSRPLRRKLVTHIERGMIAYDLETTRIRAGETPTPIYATVYSGFDFFADRTPTYESLGAFVEKYCLTRERAGARFVAWNGNKFDVYLVIRALLTLDSGYTIEPMLAGSGALRGVTVRRDKRSWLFLDGMAMTYQQCKLATFVASFAPDYPKLTHDFTESEFDPDSDQDRAYAERDVVGLWHAMRNAEQIVREFTGFPLQPTIGNLGIKYWQKMMPEGVECWQHGKALNTAVWDSLIRGGYCWTARQYIGSVDKYDINQAYTAAMRRVDLPHGSVYRTGTYRPYRVGIYHVDIAHQRSQTVPFYGRTPLGRPFFTHGSKRECWITSDEYGYLVRHGWTVNVHSGFVWYETFNMKTMVDTLERERMQSPDGPSGPRGLMIKAIGNHAYGKLAERLTGLDYCAANHCPPGWTTIPNAPHLYMRASQTNDAVYHIPYLSAFITASVRVQVMDAAHSVGEAFLYADTDSLIVEHGAQPEIVIDPKQYGAWKIEAMGAPYCIVGKKIYADMRYQHGVHCKGLHPGQITQCQMLAWYGGREPVQDQTQRISFRRFMAEEVMFQPVTRRGTNVDLLENVRLTPDRRFFAQ